MEKARSQHHQAQSENNSTKKLYLSSLPSKVREWHIRSHFSKYGEVASIHIARDSKRNFCKGYGSITFKPDVDLQRIITDEHQIFGRSILCDLFIEKGEDLEKRKSQISKRRIFVSNIPNWMSNSALKETLSKFGKVVSAYRIQKHHSKRQMPYGYVCFDIEESATKCLKEGFLFMGENCGFMLFDQYTKDQRHRLEMKKERDIAIQRFKINRKAQQNNFRNVGREAERGEIGPSQGSPAARNPLENTLGHTLRTQTQQGRLEAPDSLRNNNRDIVIPIRQGPIIAPKNKRKVHPRSGKISKKKMEEREKKRRQLLFNSLKPTERKYWEFSAKRMKHFRSYAEFNVRFNKC